MQMVKEGWKRKWDNYWFTSRRELLVYTLQVRLCLHIFEE
jgi:hypothetical protein